MSRPASTLDLGRIGRVYLTLAGGCDVATGWLLLLAPATTLSLMGLEREPDPSVFLRWIGAFVFAVGFLYLYPWLLPIDRRRVRIVMVAECTALVRGIIAIFVVLAIGSGLLEAGWWLVAAADGSMALLQVRLLRVGAFGRLGTVYE